MLLNEGKRKAMHLGFSNLQSVYQLHGNGTTAAEGEAARLLPYQQWLLHWKVTYSHRSFTREGAGTEVTEQTH